MLRIVTSQDDVRAITTQLFFIMFQAKIENYTELFQLLEQFVESNNEVYEDFHLLKFDRIMKEKSSFDQLDYYLVESFKHYKAEQLIGEFFFKAINELNDDYLFELAYGLLTFLSEHHRGTYQYMAGKGYIQIIEDKFL